MSHTTEIKSVPLRDEAAIRQAVRELENSGVDLEFLENVVPRMYYRNQSGPCDYVIKLRKSRYDVGLKKQDDGSYSAVFDAWGGDIQSQIGAKFRPKNNADGMAENIGRFLQQYSKHAAMNAAVNAGYQVMGETVDGSTGEIHLELAVA